MPDFKPLTSQEKYERACRYQDTMHKRVVSSALFLIATVLLFLAVIAKPVFMLMLADPWLACIGLAAVGIIIVSCILMHDMLVTNGPKRSKAK